MYNQEVECDCDNRIVESDIIDVGRGPNTVARYKVTFCINCNGVVEETRL